MANARKFTKPTRWQGVAIHPSGKRRTRMFPLKGEALTWAEELEATWRRDRNHDPAAGEMRVGEWIEKWLAARIVEDNTASKNATHLNRYILPAWKDWPLNSVDRLEVGAWIKRMQKAGAGAPTIEAAATLFSSIMAAAVDGGKITTNPAARQSRPRSDRAPEWFYTHRQVELILAELAEPWRTACALNFRVGMRPSELLGLRVEAVSWEHAEMQVLGVEARKGGFRRRGKTEGSINRPIPIPRDLLDDLRPLVVGRAADVPVFATSTGGALNDVNFRNRIWYPALDRAGMCAEHRPAAAFNAHKMAEQAQAREVRRREAEACKECELVPWGGPNMMRHTAASHLAMSGRVDMYRVQKLLGHGTPRMTTRYAKLSREAGEALRDAWDSYAVPENPSASSAHGHGKGPVPGFGTGP